MLKVKNIIKNFSLSAGFSLIEMIVVVGIMGTIAIIASGLLLVSLMASNKSEAAKEVRQNGNFALSVMEGMILNSSSVGCTGNGEGIWIKDLDNNLSTIIFDSQSKRIASFSGAIGVGISYPLTGSNVQVESATFSCPPDARTLGRPTKVSIYFRISKGGSDGRPSEKSRLDFTTEVMNKNIQ